MTDTSQAWDLLGAESSTWLMAPEQMSAHAAQIAVRLNGGIRAGGSRATLDHRPASAAPSSTAVIAVTGALTKRGGFLADMMGYSSYAGIRSALAHAIADSAIDKILLLVDSPGGSAAGCLECASDIVAASRRKNVTAWIAEGGMCCSAAYWLVSGANQIIASPSSEIGSIGVWQLHIDASRALEREGVTPTFIVSQQSPRKVDANAFEPLSKEAKSRMQHNVDKIATQFISAVSRGRGVSTFVVTSQFGQGAVMFADEALKVGMIDAVGTVGAARTSTPATRRADRLNALREPPTDRERRLEARQRRLEILRQG